MEVAKTRGYEIAQAHLSALYEVCSVLTSSLEYQQSVASVLSLLHDKAMLQHPMLSLLDDDGQLLEIDQVHNPHGLGEPMSKSVRYRSGEGIIGTVLSQKQPIVLSKVANDMRFMDKLDLYSLDLPFIAVPLKNESGVIGVLAAQPESDSPEHLAYFTRFMDMTANLIAKSVLLAKNVASQTLTYKRRKTVYSVR